MKGSWLSLLLVACLFSILCISCGTQVTDIDVGCDPSELIDAINVANTSPTVTTTIHLTPDCVYEFTGIETYDNTSNPAGVALPKIISPIMIDGQNATIKRASFDAIPEFRLFLVSGTYGDLTLSQLTLQNGNILSSAGFGGGILNYGKLTILESDLAYNYAGQGGAVYNEGTFVTQNSHYFVNYAESAGGAIVNTGNMHITSCELNNNDSSHTGGAIANSNGDAHITGSQFSANLTLSNQPQSAFGGAIMNGSFEQTGNASSHMNVSGSMFYLNRSGNGGAIANVYDSELHIYESTFNNNHADIGGAILNQHYMDISNSSLSNNEAETDGGAIHSISPNADSEMIINNSTISGNILTQGNAQGAAGIARYGRIQIFYTTITENAGGYGIFFHPYETGGEGNEYTRIENSIIANHTYGDCGDWGEFSSAIINHILGHANLDSDGSCPGFSLTADPMLGPLADNGGSTLTHKPQNGSPAINAATGGLAEVEDQIHQTRPIGSANDLGAFELQPELIVVPTLLPDLKMTPDYAEEPLEKPKPGWGWQFEGFVCSDMGLTEFYMKTTVPEKDFHLLINEKTVSCYQQTYDTERYWCHVDKQPLGWDVPAEITFCVGEECTAIERMTLSEYRCTSPDAPSQPETDACSTFTDERNCIAAPNCSWNCTRIGSGESCQCEGN